jgi:hypothetical protein
VAENVGTGEVICRWIDDDREPLYPTDEKALLVAYYASAELGCHLALGFPRPCNVLDLYAEFRCTTNGKLLPGKGKNSLLGALNYYRISGGDADYKDMMRERILQGPPYTPEEQALGWYYYLESNLHFPFTARCVAERAISPLRIGDKVEVVGMPSEAECEHEMFVLTPWDRRTLAVPLSQLETVAADEETRQAIED